MDEVIIKSIEQSGTFSLDTEILVSEIVEKIPAMFQPFVELFLQTQQFNSYAGKLMEILDRRGNFLSTFFSVQVVYCEICNPVKYFFTPQKSTVL